MVFEKKKIQLETLGEYLTEIRVGLKCSVAEVAGKTGIQVKFLEALEKGDFKRLPPTVYVLGFLKKLSELYSIDERALIDQYKKERHIQKHIWAKDQQGLSGIKKYFSKIVITPRLLVLFFGLFFVGATVVYVAWQVFSINKSPSLEIYTPDDGQVIRGTSAAFSGKTDPGMSVSINNQDIFVDPFGNFSAQLGISSGPKEFFVVARNKFDKIQQKKISIIGELKEISDLSRLILNLEFISSVTVSFYLDGEILGPMEFRAGDSKEVRAREKIEVSVSDAGAVRVKFKDRDWGFLGKSGQNLERVLFSQESANILE